MKNPWRCWRAQAGSNAFKKGKFYSFTDPSEFAYIVRSGEISIVLSGQDGRDMVINRMRSGDIFGELGILTRQLRSTSAPGTFAVGIRKELIDVIIQIGGRGSSLNISLAFPMCTASKKFYSLCR